MALRLEVGKTYRDRLDRCVQIASASRSGLLLDPAIYYGRTVDNRTMGWHFDGRCDKDKFSDWDLVAEVTFQVGKTYRQNNGTLVKITREIKGSGPNDSHFPDDQGPFLELDNGFGGWRHKATGLYWPKRNDPTYESHLIYGAVEDEPKSEAKSEAKSIPHADLIRAVLDGKTVQMRVNRRVGPSLTPEWSEWIEGDAAETIRQLTDHAINLEFRVKPEPIVRWVPIFRNKFGDKQNPSIGTRVNYDPKASTTAEALAALCSHDKKVLVENKAGAWLRLELDPDTLKVISATTTSP